MQRMWRTVILFHTDPLNVILQTTQTKETLEILEALDPNAIFRVGVSSLILVKINK